MENYKSKRREVVESLSKPSHISFIALGIAIALAVLVIVLTLFNTLTMRSASTTNADDYVSELTSQIAGTFSTEQQDLKTNVTAISEAISFFVQDGLAETSSDDYLTTYLSSVRASSKFSFLDYLRNDGSSILVGVASDGATDDLNLLHPGVAEAVQKGECEAYIDGEYILFSAPVKLGDDSAGVLVGGYQIARFTEMVSLQTYRDECNFCLTNREGKLIMAAGDERFEGLKPILEANNFSSKQMANELKNGIYNGKNGVLSITYADGETYLLGYAPVDGEDWMLLMLMPENLFSGTYSGYMNRAFLLTVGSAILFFVMVVLIIHAYRSHRNKLESIAFADPVTGGPNNSEFQMNYERLCNNAYSPEYAIVVLDIRDFKLFNDAGGFALGDAVLRHVYKTIENNIDEKDWEFAARTEMDHFFICMHENDPKKIQKRLDKITDEVNDHQEKEIADFKIQFDQGACIVDSPSAKIEDLQERARVARKTAQTTGSLDCVFFDDEMRTNVHRERVMSQMAEQSMANREFVVYYQPKVSISSGKVKGAEALVRWVHPQHGLISPAMFIEPLEKTGQIQALDRYVFDDVCAWLKKRQDSGKYMFPISVNLSRAHFWKENFVDEFVEIADKYDIDRQYIEFEITETYFTDASKRERIKDAIEQMHDAGFRCDVDDFGVGYSSLSLVHQMDVDVLKFDRSFFTDLSDEKSRTVVRCLINMAKELQMEMVIEGIETQDQIDFLVAEGCDLIQGYYYSKPLSESEFDAWVDAR